MHPAQKHALLAIITMIEQGFQQLKGLILTPGTSQTIAAPHQGQPPSDDHDYLSEHEEAHLEKLMRQDRERLVNETLGKDDD